jgi:hypothetical protein
MTDTTERKLKFSFPVCATAKARCCGAINPPFGGGRSRPPEDLSLSAAIEPGACAPNLLAFFRQLPAAVLRIGLRVFYSHFSAWLFLRFLSLTLAGCERFVV